MGGGVQAALWGGLATLPRRRERRCASGAKGVAAAGEGVGASVRVRAGVGRAGLEQGET